MFSRTNNFPFSPNFCFGTDNLLGTQVNQNYAPIIPPSGNVFLLSDGSSFLLSDGSELLLS